MEELFDEVVELERGNRESYLTEHCGDDLELKAEVLQLVELGEDQGEKIEAIVDHSLGDLILRCIARDPGEIAEQEPQADLPVDKLGEFRLIRKIGEGGMGEVYLAVQESLGRRVAIKILRRNEASSIESTTRFWREAEAVSRLQHPNIVSVIGCGEEKGFRFFSMEYLSGQGLDQRLREALATGERLPISTILRWVKQISLALHAAHGVQIVHRDVKPSNIHIAEDGRAVLMDFGIARRVDMTTLTVTGVFRGTILYSSPEQVRAGRQTIDARSDIYSLGVILYEALTGRVPFEGETAEQIFNQIMHDEPIAPRRLQPTISRELETVVSKAMAKTPERRYQSAALLAEEVDRLILGEPVLAKPPGVLYRGWRAVRRRPVLSTTVAVALLAALLLLSYVFMWSFPRIRQERDKAWQAQMQAETEAETTQVINEFLIKMLGSPSPEEDGRNIKVVDILDQSAADLDASFDGRPEVAAELHQVLGKSYWKLGEFQKAEIEMRGSLEIRTKELGQEHPDTKVALNNYATLLYERGKYKEAEPLLHEVLENFRQDAGERDHHTLGVMNNLGLLKHMLGRYEEAETMHRHVVSIRQEMLGEEDPSTLKAKHNLALDVKGKGRLPEAEALFRKIIEAELRVLGPEHPDTLAAMVNLARIFDDQGHFNKACSHLREVLSIEERILGEDHPSTLVTSRMLGDVLRKQSKITEALEIARRTVPLMEKELGLEHPQTLTAMTSLGLALREAGKLDQAAEILERVVDLRIAVFGAGHTDTLNAMIVLARVLLKSSDLDGCEALIRKVLKIQTDLYGENHINKLGALNMLAVIFRNRGKLEDAAKTFTQILSIAEGSDNRNEVKLALLRINYSIVLQECGDVVAAETQLKTALELMKSNLGVEHGYSQSCLKALIDFCRANGKNEEASGYQAFLTEPGE